MLLMIVEDNLGMRRLIKNLVADFAEVICECADGAAAIRMYAEQHPDWVLMDIELKQMDGIAASRQIKTDFPEAKIVIVTISDHKRLREAAREAGASGFVLKDDLRMLRSLLEKAKAH